MWCSRAFVLIAALTVSGGAVQNVWAQSKSEIQAMDLNGDGVVTRTEWQGGNGAFRLHDTNKDGRLSGTEVWDASDARPRGRNRNNRDFDDWTARGFATLDRNRDNRISSDEWRFNRESFARADHNRDNVLSRAEFLNEDTLSGNRADRFDELDVNHDGGISRGEWRDSPPAFQTLDRNRDNRITRDEWYFASDSFHLADHDRNGWLSRVEFLSEDPDPIDDDREDRFRYLDGNNDGRVARSEWHGAVLLFNALDKDRDGFLTRPEMVGTEAPPDLFTSVDVNGDGNISLPEWHWSRQSFDQRDVNKDRRLSQEEFRGTATPRANTANPYQAGYDRGLIEGHAAGREDRVVNKYWDLEGQRELETADSGYQPGMGSKDQYQAGYREAFRRTYREGWARPANQ